MQTVKIKFRELELVKTDFLHDNLHLTVHYEENKQPRTLERVFNIDDNIAMFAKNIIRDIKEDSKKKFRSSSQDELEFLSGIVNVLIEEHEDGFMEIRLIDSVRRLKDKIGFFRKVKSANNYMSNYHDLNETKIKL
jgi:hypothetical protein